MLNLAEIQWPVFRIGIKKPSVKDSIIYFEEEILNLDNAETFSNYYVIDDKNVPGNTLGLRRLQLANQEVKLFKLRIALYFLADLIKLAKSTDWFIDNSGQIFQYRKTARAKLHCKRISKVLPASTTGKVLELEHVGTRFKTLYSVDKDITPYAGVLHWGRSLILYGLYEEEFKTTFRKV